MKGEWIKRPKGKTSVIFVHGILSSGEACWRHENGAYWPELLKNEAELDMLGIYVFTYQTGIFAGTYRLGDVVDALKEHMRLDGLFDSQCIIFVCHSMGGIVVRKFLVERDTDLIQRNIEIGLFLVASPSLGSSYADWLSPLAKFMGHDQGKALRFTKDNAWLNDLDKEFMNLTRAGRLEIKGKELVEDKFIVLKGFWHKQVVEPFAGARYFGEPYKVSFSDHFSIAKPDSKDVEQHRLLCKFIKEEFKNVLVMERKIFVSVGRTSTPAQEEFVQAIEDRLRVEGLTPCTVGRNTWTAGAPLKTVVELMTQCVGAVIIALERTYFPTGIERREHPEAFELRDIRLPTPFNQVEAAMAYLHGHPLLVIVEDGLRDEGLLEKGNDWYVQRVKPTPSVLTTPEFNGILASWKEQVMAQRKASYLSKEPLQKFTIRSVV